jgi:O-antigen/teichoic acid export membrane protein
VVVEPAGGVGPRPSLLSSTFWTFLAQIATAALSLVNVLIVARSLGPSGRGEVVFLTATALLLQRIGAFGIQEANVNFGGANSELHARLATNSFLFAAVFGALAAGAMAVLIVLVPALGGGASATLLAIALASLPLLLVQLYLWRLVQADYRFAFANLVWTLPFAVNLAVNVVLALLGEMTVSTAFGAWLAGQVVGTVVLAWYVVRRWSGLGRPDLALAKRSAAFGAKTHAGRVMLQGNYRLDQWLLGVLSTPAELGVYSVAVAWSSTLQFLPSALSLAQRPDLVRGDGADAVGRAAVGFRVTLGITLAAALVMLVLAPFLVVTLLGSEFEDGVLDLRILVLGSLGVVAMKVLGTALTARGKPGLESAGIGAALVFTIALDLALIPGFGSTGASVAAAIAYTVGGVATAWIFARALGARPGELVPRRSDVAVGRELVARLWRGLRPRGRAAEDTSP